MLTVKSIEVLPSARRLIRSLRDMGYDIAAALSELVDNSIAAEARNVWIDTHFDGAGSWLRVHDDGFGMTEYELREAMRFGTRRPYESDDLGKFGLGLKSASFSQCRRFTVATKTSKNGRVRIARWDLDHVERRDRWEVLRPDQDESSLASFPIRSRIGTSIVWEGMDRVSRFRYPSGQRAASDFRRLTDEISGQLAMTFHRFLSGEARSRRRVAIHINGEQLLPWDPFCRQERATVHLPEQRVRMAYQGHRFQLVVRPYVLPAESRFSSSDAHRRAAGPYFWTRQQGFYFYRNDRLIQAGGWSRLRTQDEHTKLARVAVDLPSHSDEAFELNVSKTQIRIPTVVRSHMLAIASATCRLAEDAYRRPSADGRSTEQIANSRIDALATLVRMLIDAADRLLARELANSAGLHARLVAQLRSMENELLAEAATKLGLVPNL